MNIEFNWRTYMELCTCSLPDDVTRNIKKYNDEFVHVSAIR